MEGEMKMVLELRTESRVCGQTLMRLGCDGIPPLYGKAVIAVAEADNASYL